MKLYDILFIIDRGAVEGALHAIELRILPYLRIVAHHLSVTAVDDCLGRADSCVIDDGVVEGEHLEDLLGFSVEEMEAAAEGDLVVGEEVEEGAVVREGALLAVRCDLVQDGVGTVSMVIG